MKESKDIQLTPEALREAERLAVEVEAHRGLPLRVYIEGKGCDGFYYGVSFDDHTERDVAYTQGSLTIIVDPDSLEFMAGSLVTWVDDERGKGFLVENPNQRKFRGKFFKRKAWQEKLEGRGATSSSR